MSNIHNNDQFWAIAGPGQFNDPDMLEVGNGRLTYDEQVSHFSLWCLVKSPLILGNDLSTMTAQTLSVLTNDEAIAVNQDPLAKQGHFIRASNNNATEIWAGPLKDGSYAVVMINLHDSQSFDIITQWSDIGLPDDRKATVRDLWKHQDIGVFTGSYSAKQVQPHASIMLRITPANSKNIANHHNVVSA